MIQLKSCPRCRGDMLVEELLDDPELLCLQCGYRSPLRPEERSFRRGLVAVTAGGAGHHGSTDQR